MADRVLVWHLPKNYGGPVSLPQYYMDTPYEPLALRVRAEDAPVEDMRIDIRADGVSIFKNQPAETFTTAGYRSVAPTSTVVLVAGDTTEVDAADFKGSGLERGQWISCEIVEKAGAEGITISLELARAGEQDEEVD